MKIYYVIILIISIAGISVIAYFVYKSKQTKQLTSLQTPGLTTRSNTFINNVLGGLS